MGWTRRRRAVTTRDVHAPDTSPLRYDGAFVRRLARLGAGYGPPWLLRYSPAFFGLAAAALLPPARRVVRENLTRVRGEAGMLRDAIDVGRTFATYAGCFAEGLASGAPNFALPEATVFGELHLKGALARGTGVVFATAHTGGWEIVGPLLGRDRGLRVMMAMHEERDRGAARIQDGARAASGLSIVHVGVDPLASLALLRHVQGGGAAALQVDRTLPGQRTVPVRLFDADGALPEGPFRLAQLSGAPVLPVFCARLGFRRYVIDVAPPITLARRAGAEATRLAAQTVADAMTRFLRAHPTQWFRFRA